MTTVIIPVDFSTTSLHAANYASELFMGHEDITLLLYHSYSKRSEAEKAELALDELKNKLVEEFSIKAEVLAHESSDFIEGLERVVRHRTAKLVIMGITERSVLAQTFVGSDTLKMAQTKACPVLVVPEKASFRPIKNVMLSSDFKDTVNTTPSGPIKDFLELFKPNLHIVNVDSEHYIAITEAYENEKRKLQQMFEAYNPEFYFLRLYDVDDALNLFAEAKSIDINIAIQKDHSFIQKLLLRSRTKSLSYHSHIPVLIIHS